MPRLMTYVMINFPSPEEYLDILEIMFTNNVDYIEIQLPFTNPVADGELIYAAHQQALKFQYTVTEEIKKIAQLKEKTKSKSKLILMSYTTPIFNFGLSNLLGILKENYFQGVIVPDLLAGSSEQIQLSQESQDKGLDWIPLISPLTSEIRLKKILKHLTSGQLIYAMARKGKTGKKTDFDSSETQNYFNFLKKNLSEYEILIGFGVKEKMQLEYLNKLGFLVVIASELIKRLSAAKESNLTVKEITQNFLQELGC